MSAVEAPATELTDDVASELADVACSAAEAGARTSLAAWQRRAHLVVSTKADLDDLVTDADLRTQEAVFDVIAHRRPQDRLHGEETDRSITAALPASAGALDWWVDPIDGTTSFVYGRADWSVSVAAVDPRTGAILAGAVSEPVLGRLTCAVLGRGAWCDGQRLKVSSPAELRRALVEVNLGTHAQRASAGVTLGRLATGVRDIRRGGSAAAALAAVAGGRADAAWLPGLQTWDGAAGVLIAFEAGATVGDLRGATDARWPSSGDVLAAPASLFHGLHTLLAHS